MRFWRWLHPVLVLLALTAACSPASSTVLSVPPAAPTPAVGQAAAQEGTTDAVRAAGVGFAEAVARITGECPVTSAPNPPFNPPKPYSAQAPYKGAFWYGSARLWTMLRDDGTWRALPKGPNGYTQKVFWWRQGYEAAKEPQPHLTVTGRRLDGDAPPLVASRATNGYHGDLKSFMLVGVDIPTEGCWQITGRYGDQELAFVVRVQP